jgi:hypothetical protein
MRSLAAALCLAAAGVAAACGTAGERPPATPAAAPSPAEAPDNASSTAVLPAPRVAQPQPAPAPAPAEPAAAAKPPRKPRPPEPEIEIQWGTIDSTIPTPDDIHPDRILAKFRAPDGAVIVVYTRARDGQLIRRRIRGLGSSGMKMVEEKFLEEGPPPAP